MLHFVTALGEVGNVRCVLGGSLGGKVCERQTILMLTMGYNLINNDFMRIKVIEVTYIELFSWNNLS